MLQLKTLNLIMIIMLTAEELEENQDTDEAADNQLPNSLPPSKRSKK